LFGNGSYYFDRDDYHSEIPNITFSGGVYYIDTLFSRNLYLKSGVNFKFTGNQNYFLYDFQKSTQVKYIQKFGSDNIQLISDEIIDPSFQIDLFLAGEIQEAAIVYFVFENLLGSQYYIVPYYPTRSRGIRFGLSWELFD